MARSHVRATLFQKVRLKAVCGVVQLRLALEVLIDGVQGAGDLGSVSSGDASGESLRVANTVTLTHRPPDSVVMEWQGDPVGDAIADTVIAVILQVSPGLSQASSLKEGACIGMTMRQCRWKEDTLRQSSENTVHNACNSQTFPTQKDLLSCLKTLGDN